MILRVSRGGVCVPLILKPPFPTLYQRWGEFLNLSTDFMLGDYILYSQDLFDRESVVITTEKFDADHY